MTRERAKYQIWYQESIDDPGTWHKYVGELWSKEAAQQRLTGLQAVRPSRRYRITERTYVIETKIIYESERHEQQTT